MSLHLSPGYGLPPFTLSLPSGVSVAFLSDLRGPVPAGSVVTVYWPCAWGGQQPCEATIAIAHTRVTPNDSANLTVAGAVTASAALSAPGNPGDIRNRDVTLEHAIPAGASVFVVVYATFDAAPPQLVAANLMDHVRVCLAMASASPPVVGQTAPFSPSDLKPAQFAVTVIP